MMARARTDLDYAFRSYVDLLAAALGEAPAQPAAVAAALDGEVSVELRARVELSIRRSHGTFLTPRPLAQALTRPVRSGRRYIDPAVGCGDLLLAVAATRIELIDRSGG